MKYGKHLKENIAPEYGPEPYLQYRLLDDIIRAISEKAPKRRINVLDYKVSLSSSGRPLIESFEKEQYTEETFFTVLDDEMAKVEKFTLSKVTELRAELSAIEVAVKNITNDEDKTKVQNETELLAQGFLRLEKYVNLNFMGFHKILKKHDKYIPSNPCKVFYVNRMHNQSWVRGDYSDLVVSLSSIYSKLRDDTKIKENKSRNIRQNFFRTSTRYWVKTEDVSRVKYQVLKHLPVFLQNASTGETDSQLINSVFLDNDQLELYHGRLGSTNKASTLRLRWYGTRKPSLVFVERQTNRDTCVGASSSKERFTVDEAEVKNIMSDQYDIRKVKDEMLNVKKISKEQVDEWEVLAREVTQVIASKQLVPTMRTQYMRTAFQMPFDASVRVSLDTNLCMISERGYDLQHGKVWHRNASQPLAENEITRFPHAVLEIKLESNNEDSKPPSWVQELLSSGMLYEVHKFCKFVHGCATLLPDDVRKVPYWVDDISLRDSILSSGAAQILVRKTLDESRSDNLSATTSSVYDRLLPFGTDSCTNCNAAYGQKQSFISSSTPKKVRRKSQSSLTKYTQNDAVEFEQTYDEEEDDEGGYNDSENERRSWASLVCCPSRSTQMLPPPSIQIDPNVFLANERTFLHWLDVGATLVSISSAILAFSSEESQYAHWYAMSLMFISLGFCIHALQVLIHRTARLKSRVSGRWDDPRGPIIVCGALTIILLVNLFLSIDWLIMSLHRPISR